MHPLKFTPREGCPFFEPTLHDWHHIDSHLKQARELTEREGLFLVKTPRIVESVHKDLHEDGAAIDLLDIEPKHQTSHTMFARPGGIKVAKQQLAEPSESMTHANFEAIHEERRPGFCSSRLQSLERIYWEEVETNKHQAEHWTVSHEILLDNFGLTLTMLRNNELKKLRDSVEGITKPQVVGSTLHSTFAAHREDHDVCAINTVLYGAPKQWYAVRAKVYLGFKAAINILDNRETLLCSRHI